MEYLLEDMITPFLYAMGVDTPNKVTMLNFCVVRTASVYVVLFGGVAGMWLQFVLMPLTQVLDAADGQMARRYGLGSEFGASLDHLTDNVFGVCWAGSGLYRIYIAQGLSTPFVIFSVTLLIIGFFGNSAMVANEASTHYSKMSTVQKIGMHQELYMTYVFFVSALYVTTLPHA